MRPKAAKSGTILLGRIAKRRSPPPKLNRAPVEANEAAVGAAHAKARRNGIQRALTNVLESVQAGRRRGGFRTLTTHVVAPPKRTNAAGRRKFHTCSIPYLAPPARRTSFCRLKVKGSPTLQSSINYSVAGRPDGRHNRLPADPRDRPSRWGGPEIASKPCSYGENSGRSASQHVDPRRAPPRHPLQL